MIPMLHQIVREPGSGISCGYRQAPCRYLDCYQAPQSTIKAWWSPYRQWKQRPRISLTMVSRFVPVAASTMVAV